MHRQRAYYQRGILSNDRIKRLEDIDFAWDPFEVQWEEMLEVLKEYKAEFGDCNVPYGWLKNKQLGAWVTTQRGYYKNNTLSTDRIKRLDDIGFLWTSREELDEKRWGEMLDMLREYKEDNGDCNVPRRWPKNEQLASWVSTQRQGYKNNKLSEDRIKRLEEIGFELAYNLKEKQEEVWGEMFEVLKEYKEEYGNCNVPLEWPKNKQLGRWVNAQRTRYKDGALSEDRIERLEDIGFEWKRILYTRSKSSWEEVFTMLKEYKDKHGNCNVPQEWGENKQLAVWASTQRQGYKSNKLSEDRIKRLEEIGFEWDPFGSFWEEMFDTLKEYKENHGDCNVPYEWPENEQLGRWVGTQRRNCRKGLLSEDRIKRLEDIGFEWDPSESYWEKIFDALKEYKEEYGNCNVPKRWPKNKQLATWVSNQRVSYRKGILSEDRIRRLEDIGVELTYNRKEKEEERWGEMLEALKEYKEEHGNCDVPSLCTENKQLGVWVGRQRAKYQRGILSSDRIKRLEDMGFLWPSREELDEKRWEEMLDVLKEYKEEFGNCNVPYGWPKNKQLGSWLANQRTNYKNGTLSEDRIRRLEDIGFELTYNRKEKEEERLAVMLEVLKEYKEEYGNCNVPQRWPKNKPLASWVANQRTNYKNGKLSTDRIKRLEDIGFEWKRISYTYYKLPWEEVFTMLKEYKDKHGNCNVPSLYKENKQLANWVQTQRTTFKNGTLNEDRIKRLEEIGFVWNILKR